MLAEINRQFEQHKQSIQYNSQFSINLIHFCPKIYSFKSDIKIVYITQFVNFELKLFQVNTIINLIIVIKILVIKIASNLWNP